jgi:hypothetical protein
VSRDEGFFPSTPGTRHVVLLAEMHESGVQQGAGDRNHPCVRRDISRIKKTAPETDSAETNKLVTTVPLKGRIGRN